MNNIFVYCEITEEGHVADVSQELLTKGRSLADELKVKLEAVVIGAKLNGIEKKSFLMEWIQYTGQMMNDFFLLLPVHMPNC